MLSKSRLTAVFALGLASTLVVIGLLLPRLFPEQTPVSLGITHRTLTLVDEQAAVGPGFLHGDEAKPGAAGKQPKPVTAPVARQFNMDLGEPATETEATARVGVSTFRTDVDDDLDSLLNAQVWSYRIDRVTGEAVGQAKVSDTPATPPRTHPMAGHWAKFPVDTQKQSYDYFDWVVREAFPAEFKSEEVRRTPGGDDVTVYIFRQELQTTDVGKHFKSIRTSATIEGEDAPLTHRGWREIAVEPDSGMIVGVEENITNEYSADGKQVQPLLKFHGRTTERNEADMLEQAHSMKGIRSTKAWGWGIFGVGVALLIASLVIALRPTRKNKNS